MKKIIILIILLVILGTGWFLFRPGQNIDQTEGATNSTSGLNKEDGQISKNNLEGTESLENNEGDIVEVENEWKTYTSDEWKFSFEYPGNYDLVEREDGFKVTLTPFGEVKMKTDFFSVIVIQYPDVEDRSMIPRALFYRANLPNGELAWFKDDSFFKSEDHIISVEETTYGASSDQFAFKVRDKSIAPELGEYRTLFYILRDPAIYRVTFDLLSYGTHKKVIDRINSSFKVIK
jgi:hypothetical protein